MNDALETLEYLIDVAKNGLEEGYKTMNSSFVIQLIEVAISELRKASEK